MSVRENLDFTLRRHFKDLTESEINTEIDEVLESVGLSEAIDKMPSELSGGMRKRIGLKRTFNIKT
jgi:phospholipid/cholesterol/gamma-HCH transport system ATP-binding protein